MKFAQLNDPHDISKEQRAYSYEQRPQKIYWHKWHSPGGRAHRALQWHEGRNNGIKK